LHSKHNPSLPGLAILIGAAQIWGTEDNFHLSLQKLLTELHPRIGWFREQQSPDPYMPPA